MTGDIERIREALHFIPPSDRETWVKMGMAVKAELGDQGFDVWESWSEQDESFDPKAARDVWKSIRGNGKVTAGTLFHEAKKRGWRNDGTQPAQTPQQIEEHRRIARERAAAEEIEKAKRAARAREQACLTWAEARPCATHPYLTRKDIGANGVRVLGDELVIPLRDATGTIHSLQFINPKGKKRFMPDGRVKGCFFSIGELESSAVICIAEGFATGATIYAATKYAVVVAFNAGNLGAVAKVIRGKFSDVPLVLCADDDHGTKDNPGLTKATNAARSVGGLLAIPHFGDGRPDGATDFNDMAQHSGTESVKQAIVSAAMPVGTSAESKVTGVTSVQANDDAAFADTPSENEGVTGETGEAQGEIPENGKRQAFHVFDDWLQHGDAKFRPGVWYFDADKDNCPTQTWICSPLHVDAVTFDDQDNNFGRLLRFKNTLGNWREWAMPMELLRGAGDDMRGELLAMGVEIAPSSKARNLLATYLQSAPPERRMRCALQVGWCDGSFVLPDKVIGTKASDVIFQSGERGRDEHTLGGSLAGWRLAIASRAVGNPLLMLGLSAAFAGPLLQLCNAESGGLHIVGDSSTGKTTIIEAACSIWGGPKFRRSWRATANGMEGAAALFNDSLLALDEISECDPKEVGAIVYALGNGRGKQRASRTGSARSVTHWRCVVLSSGERSIATTMAEGGHRIKAGQSMRLLDLPASRAHGAWDTLHEMQSGAAYSDALKNSAATHYGHAGRGFLEKLTRDIRNFPEFLERIKALPAFAGAADEGQDKRAAARFALYALAGELATEYGITGWKVGDAINAAAEMFKTWQIMRGRGNDERRQILDQVSGFIERHGDGRFSNADGDDDVRLPVRDRAGWWRDTSDGRTYLFTSTGLREALKGFEFKRALDVLQEVGALPTPGADGKRATPQRIKSRGANTVRLYHVYQSKLGDDYGIA